MKYVEVTPRSAVDIAHCYFHHAMDLPNYGRRYGAWNLIGRFDDYIGNQNLMRQTVLDIAQQLGFLHSSLTPAAQLLRPSTYIAAKQLSDLPLRGSEFVEAIPLGVLSTT